MIVLKTLVTAPLNGIIDLICTCCRRKAFAYLSYFDIRHKVDTIYTKLLFALCISRLIAFKTAEHIKSALIGNNKMRAYKSVLAFCQNRFEYILAGFQVIFCGIIIELKGYLLPVADRLLDSIQILS